MMTLINRLRELKLSSLFLLSMVVFAIIKIIFNSQDFVRLDQAVLAPVAILFGFFINNLIGKQRSRYEAVFDLDSTENSILYSIYHLSKTLPKKDEREKIKDLIEEYFIAKIDYKFKDHKLTDTNFSALFDYCMNTGTESILENDFRMRSSMLFPSQQERRLRIQTLLSSNVARSEWLTMGCLYVASIYSFIQINSEGFAASLLIVILCSATTMMVLLLYKMDAMKFKADVKIWEPMELMFKDMELLPYYPEDYIKRGLAKPAKGQTIRVAKYPNIYPDMSGKDVVEVEV